MLCLNGWKDIHLSFNLVGFKKDILLLLMILLLQWLFSKLCSCRPRKHKEKRFDLSESVFSLRPAPQFYWCVRESIVCKLEILSAERKKPDCCRPESAVVSALLDCISRCLSHSYQSALHHVLLERVVLQMNRLSLKHFVNPTRPAFLQSVKKKST